MREESHFMNEAWKQTNKHTENFAVIEISAAARPGKVNLSGIQKSEKPPVLPLQWIMQRALETIQNTIWLLFTTHHC